MTTTNNESNEPREIVLNEIQDQTVIRAILFITGVYKEFMDSTKREAGDDDLPITSAVYGHEARGYFWVSHNGKTNRLQLVEFPEGVPVSVVNAIVKGIISKLSGDTGKTVVVFENNNNEEGGTEVTVSVSEVPVSEVPPTTHSSN